MQNVDPERERKKRILRHGGGTRCSYCGGSGWMMAYRPAEPFAEISFVCTCSAAEILGIKEARLWKDVVADEGFIARMINSESDKAWMQAVSAYQQKGKTK